MEKDYAYFLLNKTKEDYDRIARKFSGTRSRLSNDIIALTRFVQDGDRVLDLGCGNGRLEEIFEGRPVDYVGADVSGELLKSARLAHPRGNFVLMADPLKLPFNDASFDKVFCLAVFHHVPSDDLRSRFLMEVRRVLKTSGRLVLTVWYLWPQPRTKWLIAKYAVLRFLNLAKLDFKDIFLPFKVPEAGISVGRYLHCFTIDELEKAVRKAGFEIEAKAITKRGRAAENYNILIVAEKHAG